MIPPGLKDIESFYWQAFWDLSTERQASMGGASPLPLSKIKEYGAENFGPGNEFVEIMRKMDAAYLSHKDKKAAEPKRGSNDGNRSARPKG